jgi:hypothetical protein
MPITTNISMTRNSEVIAEKFNIVRIYSSENYA